jgi:hypothetical protein
MLPGVGGITYNCKVGDSALQWAADHVEPGVSVKAQKEDENNALNIMACIGNVARVVSGDAKGARGIVTGKHGGIEHVLVDFPDTALKKLVVGDKIQIHACGLGLAAEGLPGIAMMNMDPALPARLGWRRRGETIAVPAAHRVPAAVMGSGIGRSHVFRGDYDIELFDEQIVEQYHLSTLRLGDIVAVEDAAHDYGRTYRTGAVSIAVVVHSCCKTSGHGPGLTSLASSRDGMIDVVIDPTANLADRLTIGRTRPRRRT